jgi:hypothetical protein
MARAPHLERPAHVTSNATSTASSPAASPVAPPTPVSSTSQG